MWPKGPGEIFGVLIGRNPINGAMSAATSPVNEDCAPVGIAGREEYHATWCGEGTAKHTRGVGLPRTKFHKRDIPRLEATILIK